MPARLCAWSCLVVVAWLQCFVECIKCRGLQQPTSLVSSHNPKPRLSRTQSKSRIALYTNLQSHFLLLTLPLPLRVFVLALAYPFPLALHIHLPRSLPLTIMSHLSPCLCPCMAAALALALALALPHLLTVISPLSPSSWAEY